MEGKTPQSRIRGKIFMFVPSQASGDSEARQKQEMKILVALVKILRIKVKKN